MNKKFTILSIEDSKEDFDLIEQALEKIPNIDLDIIHISNGKDALDFLYKKYGFEDSPTPNIIILDMNLPSINGKEILKNIKNNDKYKMIPVIIFTTSEDKSEIEETYKLHANSYVTKTFDINELYNKIKLIGEYWLKINELPNNNNFFFQK